MKYQLVFSILIKDIIFYHLPSKIRFAIVLIFKTIFFLLKKAILFMLSSKINLQQEVLLMIFVWDQINIFGLISTNILLIYIINHQINMKLPFSQAKACHFTMIAYKLLVALLLVYRASAGCQINQCDSCPGNDYICASCKSGYHLYGGVCCRQTCSACTKISNYGVCSACINSGFYLNTSNSQCRACSNAIPNCQTCSNQTSCTTCASTYINNGTSCFTCSTSMPGCVSCTSPTACTACANNTVTFNSTLNQCVACSTVLNGCSTCTSSNNCTACLNTSYILNSSTNICDACSSWMNQCVTCNSTTVCTACSNNSYVLNSSSSSVCVACSSLLVGCLQCNSSTVCISCVNNTYTYNSSNSECASCSLFMSFCLYCNNNTDCTTCQSLPNLIVYNKKCQFCNTIAPNCLNCTSSTHCTLCNRYYIANSNYSCVLCSNVMYGCMDCNSLNICTKCTLGQIVTNGCSSIPGCIVVIQTGKSQNPVCSLCNSIFYFSQPVDGVCVCIKGHLAGQYCSLITGCLNIIRNSLGNVCTMCDSSKTFILQNGTCLCPANYELISESCVQICGDGKVVYLPCDDGNKINGDGCSSSCQPETGYICIDGSINHASKCLYKGKVDLKYICTYKLDGNLAQIRLTINPFIPNFFKSHLNINFNSSKNCTMTSHSLADSYIILIVSYLQNIEGQNASATIEYDKNYIISPNDTARMQLNQCNGDRLYYDLNSTKSLKYAIIWMIKILSAAVLLVWLVGSYSHKMIGVETLHTFQLIFIPQVFATRYYPVVVYFNELYNILNIYQKKLTPQYSLSSTSQNRLNYSADFIYNHSAVAISQLVILLAFAFLAIYNKFNCQANNQQIPQANNQKEGFRSKINRYKRFIYDFLVFPVVVGFFLNFILSLMIHSNSNFQKYFTNKGIQLLCILFTVFSTSFVYISEWKQLFIKEKLKQTQINHKSNYVPLYLSHFFILCLIIESAVASLIPNPIIILLGFSVIYTIIIIVYSPYDGWLHNLSLFINHTGIVLNLCWLLSQQFMYLSRAKDEMIALIMIGWMVLILIFAILRIIFQLKRKKEFAQKLEEQNLSSMNMKEYKVYESKMRKTILDQTSNNINAYLITSQLTNLKREEQQQLTKRKQNQIKQQQHYQMQGIIGAIHKRNYKPNLQK